jgi:hypothetical protein
MRHPVERWAGRLLPAITRIDPGKASARAMRNTGDAARRATVVESVRGLARACEICRPDGFPIDEARSCGSAKKVDKQ